MQRRRILFLLTRAPYASAHSLETLESVLVAGVFEQEVSVLFRGSGVLQLLKGQNGRAVGQRTVGKVLEALPEYEVERIYVCERSLQRFGIGEADFCISVHRLDERGQRELIAGQDAVVSG